MFSWMLIYTYTCDIATHKMLGAFAGWKVTKNFSKILEIRWHIIYTTSHTNTRRWRMNIAFSWILCDELIESVFNVRFTFVFVFLRFTKWFIPYDTWHIIRYGNTKYILLLFSINKKKLRFTWDRFARVEPSFSFST